MPASSLRLRHALLMATVLASPFIATPSHAQTTGAAAPAAKAPLPNRVNDVLPRWLRVRGELRERVEGIDNSGYTDGRDDVFSLTRVRLNVSVTSPYVGATVQVADARVAGKDVGPVAPPFRAPFDLRQSFVDLGNAKTPVTARLGRQEMAYGDQRLIGPLNWLNTGRTFDGGTGVVRTKAATVNLFAASVVRVFDNRADRSGNGNLLAGTYISMPKVIRKATVDPYVIFHREHNQLTEARVPGDLHQGTVGVRLAGGLPAALDYNVEMGLQRGSLGSDELSAWAGHWQLRRTFTGRTTPHLTAEYNRASGDESPTDGTRGTFDQLFGSPHDKLGLADLVGWRNISHVRVGFDVTPIKSTPITVNWHDFRLVEARDGLYAAGGALVARIPAGAASTHVGNELDVQATHPITPQLALGVGYARMFTGDFLKQATPGRSFGSGYLMLTWVFLADR